MPYYICSAMIGQTTVWGSGLVNHEIPVLTNHFKQFAGKSELNIAGEEWSIVVVYRRLVIIITVQLTGNV